MDVPTSQQSVDPLHHQGMSPTLEGEEQGPEYGRSPVPLRHGEDVLDRQAPAPIPNGIPVGRTTFCDDQRTSLDGRAGQAGSTSQATAEPRQLPVEGTGLLRGMDASTTAPVSSVPVGLANEREPMSTVQLPIFPRFSPSPLPGQSPSAMRSEGRNTSWFSRLGDYIQRRVEVTAWSSPPSLGTATTGVWQNQQTMMVSSPGAGERRAESNSSGSVGISPEVLQAEVSRQLDAAMGEMVGKLNDERRRAEDAAAEAQRLRVELQRYESRMVVDQQPLVVPPGLEQPAASAITSAGMIPGFETQPIMGHGETVKDATVWYNQYASASPLARLQLQPRPSVDLRPEWARVERRATAMMLTAVPKPIREEIIANGQVSSLVVLCKLYAVYQPGNLQEKTLVLRMLEQPEECITALQAVEGLRKWSLWRKRAATLGMAEPDASVLVRGLDRIAGQIIKGSGELAFRVSLIRSTLQVDVSPSSATVTTFLQHLQAEMEQQARLGNNKLDGGAALRAIAGQADATANATPAAGNTSTTGSPTAPRGSGLCKYFVSDKGCRRGNACRYPHTWALLEKGARQRKCLCCGSSQHKVKDCKAPGGGQSPTRTNGRQGGVGASDTGATSTTTSPTEATVKRVNFESVPDLQMKVMRVLQEVQQLDILKPILNAISCWTSTTSPTTTPRSRDALLDSGATHILRKPKDLNEWNQAKSVSVQLAGDSSVTMKQTSDGTLLTGDTLAQVIVPLGKVISTLGYRLHWDKDVCELQSDEGEVLPLTVVKGCPELPESTAAALISQLEAKQLPELRKSTATTVKAIGDAKQSWWSHLIDYVRGGCTDSGRRAVDKMEYFDYKQMLKEKLVIRQPRPGIWELMKALTLNRRARKRLLRASSIMVRWDPPAVDRHRDPLRHLMYVGDSVYLNVNTLLVENEFDEVWKLLWWMAVQGRVSHIVARDVTTGPLDQLSGAPHRSKVHWLHALSSAGRAVRGGDGVQLHVEGSSALVAPNEPTASSTPVPWCVNQDAAGYFSEMGLTEVMIESFSGGRVARLAKMDSDAAWRLHVARGHTPYRRDCSVCVRNAATGRQHRATLHPSAYTLSMDIAGPIKGRGLSPDGKYFRFFLVGAFRIPVIEGGIGRDDELRGHPLPAGGDPEDEEELSEEDVDSQELPLEEEVSDYCGDELRKEREQWERMKATFKEPLKTETLYFCVPVNGKKAVYTLPALQQMITEIKALGYPVVRVHSDRGGEFRGNLVKRWLASQGILRTTSTGSEPAENGVAEAGVRYLKRRARTLLDSGRLSRVHWPTAIQMAAVQQRCGKLGIPDPTVVAYGARVYVKVKKYKTGDVESFSPHWLQGWYLGPSTDVRGGHVILKPSGTFLTTTHVRVTTDPPPLDQVVPTVIVDPEEPEAPPLPPPDVPPIGGGVGPIPLDEPPLRRVRKKAPSVRQLQPMFPVYVSFEELEHETSSTTTDLPILRGLRPEDTYEVELMAAQMLDEGSPTKQGCAKLMDKIGLDCGNLKVPRARDGCGLLLGAYVHGGTFGVTSLGKELRWTTLYLNKFLKERLKETTFEVGDQAEFTWASIALQHASEVPLHKDVHNQKGSRNFVIEIKRDPHAGLWVQDDQDGCAVQGGGQAEDFQWSTEKVEVHDGCLFNIEDNPAIFAPTQRHGYIKDNGARWFLSAYTPHGVHRLSEADKIYLESCGFPLPPPPAPVSDEVLETRPMLRATFFPQNVEELCGARSFPGEVKDAVVTEDNDETWGEWGIYVEEEAADDIPAGLRKMCDSEGPGSEADLLWRTSQAVLGLPTNATYQEDIADCVDGWVRDDGCVIPRMAKLEPEYTPNIEELIKELMDTNTPLRHTHNVSPQEARQALDAWKGAISKELGVVEKGFRRSTVEEVKKLKQTHKVQELPAKLVYTIKPPSNEPTNQGEAKYCKRKARIVCCGNYASPDQADIFASGAAAESLRSCLTYTAWRRWVTALLDIAGAFMLTPLPQGANEVVYAVQPPSVLVKLGLASEGERWILTHGMYGLRQSPRLWSEYRDSTIKEMRFVVENEEWLLKQGDAEPNLWLLVRASDPAGEPEALVLIYVDDILLCGKMLHLRSVANKLSSTWKTTELEILSESHGIRFLGCEILTTGMKDRFYLHQQPYIKEIIRAHDISDTMRSPIQAPKHLVTFEAELDEAKGSEAEVKLAQRLCGELLWLAQRTRPDISFTVNAMGALISRAAPRCVAIGYKLLAYLQHTQEYALTIAPSTNDLVTFTDSSYAPEGKRSHSGILVTWMGSPISWRATRTPYICLSTAESELTAAIEGLKMTLSLGAVLEELIGRELPIQLAIDNQSTIAIAKPSGSTSWRTRHLRVRSAFIREQVQAQKVVVKYVKGKEQLADLLTKSFPRQRLEELVNMWGIGRMTEGSAATMLKAMIICTMIQSARAHEPLALDTSSLELYVVVVIVAVAVIGIWEFATAYSVYSVLVVVSGTNYAAGYQKGYGYPNYNGRELCAYR
ncbi:Copia protein [Symbiodinium microadriaticum]|uniref:Copia protein n=1 Tax=Symbiodinium microadriaticum TaxID=2951 RepID=A0A1Q9CQI7_SYMMI|nr:Copia protein [Symbiodinium microadriaticum]